MSTEQRLVRPFVDLAPVRSWIRRTALEFAGSVVPAGGGISVAVGVFVSERLAIQLAEDAEHLPDRLQRLADAVDTTGIPADALELVLVLSTPRLQRAEVAWRSRLPELARQGHRVEVGGEGRRPGPLSAPFGGCDAQLALVMAETLPPAPLVPHRRGTWLARAWFTIATDLGQIGFTPIPLTDDVRREHDLPARTLRLVIADRVTDPEMDPDAALSVYVDQEVLAQLTAEPNARGSKSLQMQLFLDAMTAVVHAASREINAGDGSDSYLEAQDSLLGSLFRQMAARSDGEVDVDLAQRYWNGVKNHPERTVALIEGWLPDFKKALVNAISEGDR